MNEFDFEEIQNDVAVKIKLGKQKCVEFYQKHKNVVIGVGAASIALVGGLIGSKRTENSMIDSVKKAERDRDKAINEKNMLSNWLEYEVHEREDNEHLNSIVHLPNGENMSIGRFADEVLDKAETEEINKILSRK